MKSANIATAKNQFSRLLKRVRQGETILITDRNRPVALLQPVQETAEVLKQLHSAGIVAPPSGKPLDVKKFLKAPRPRLTPRHSLSSAIIAEREESR